MPSKAQLLQRLRREKEDIEKNYQDSLHLEVKDADKNIWHVSFMGANIYQGEKYTLQFRFTDEYPFDSPEVMFIGVPPKHEHIYACGYICLSTLDSDWTPALKTSGVVMSILSMMSSATEKSEPPNNQEASNYMKNRSPKDVNWLFEDDKC